MKKKIPIAQTGDGETPILGVDEEIAKLKTVVDFKMSHVVHQQRLKLQNKSKKARKKRKK